MGTGLIALALVAVFALSLAWTYSSNRRLIARLKAAAAELGYEFAQSSAPWANLRGSGGRESAVPEINAAPEAAAAPAAQGSPGPQGSLASVLADIFAAWRIRGREDGEAVAIYAVSRGSGRSRTTYTVVEMSVHPRDGGSFAITNEGFLSKLGQGVLGLSDIQSGDAEFDAKAKIKGQDEAGLRRLLESSEARRAIASALDAYRGISITNEKIVYERRGSISRADYFRPLIAAMAAVARAMRAA